jgi:HlyD family secretion protein
MKSKKLPLIIVAVLILAGVVIAVLIGVNSSSVAAGVKVSGNIEVIEAEVSFKIPGRVVERAVDEGSMVKEGQLVARLEDADIKNQVAVAAASLASAEASLAALVAGSRPEEISAAEAAAAKAKAAYDAALAGSRPQEIAAADADAAAAAANVDKLKLDFAREQELYNGKVTSKSDFDAARTALDAAEATLKAAAERAKLVREGPRKEDVDQAKNAAAQAAEQYELVKLGPRKEDIDNGRARADEARQALALAETELSYATVYSPLAGVVLSKNIEPGEYVAPGTPVVTVGDLVNVYLRAYINETDLGRVKLGQRVRITADTYPGKVYDGTVSFISSQAEFTPKNVQTPKERVKLVYRIKVDVKNSDMELKAGMPADGLIETGNTAGV